MNNQKSSLNSNINIPKIVIENKTRIVALEEITKSMREDIQETRSDIKELLDIVRNGLVSKVNMMEKEFSNHINQYEKKTERKFQLWSRPVVAGIVGSCFTIITTVVILIITGEWYKLMGK